MYLGSVYLTDHSGWYRREDNNGWRLVSDRLIPHIMADPITWETSQKKYEYHHDKVSYRKIPKFSDARKSCCYIPKIQTRRSKHRVFYQNVANGIANSEDPDQTAPLGAV